MEILEAIRTRRSIRSYKPEPVPPEILKEIVEACQWASSPGNMQPWEFSILGGEVIEEFKKLLYEKRVANAPSELEFAPPLEVPEIYDKRRTEHRKVLNDYMYPPGEENVDEKKRAYFLSGARLFNAPNAIIVYTDKKSLDIPWVEESIGIIVQTVSLAALSYGLGTCVMGGPVDFPNILRELLGIPQSMAILNE